MDRIALHELKSHPYITRAVIYSQEGNLYTVDVFVGKTPFKLTDSRGHVLVRHSLSDARTDLEKANITDIALAWSHACDEMIGQAFESPSHGMSQRL